MGLDSVALAAVVSGNDVIVGGQFTYAGGVPANRVAIWDGNSWTALGSGLNDRVYAVAATGSVVYAGGDFTTADGSFANHIAKWNGTQWSALGDGINGLVQILAVIGSDLYAGGQFSMAGGDLALGIAKWDGSKWSALGAGLDYPASGLAATGNRLYAGGMFTNVGNYIAVWNGNNWSALGGGVDGWVNAIAISDNNVYVGGNFEIAGEKLSSFLARWFASSVCPSAINPISATLGVAATNATVAVTAATDCVWTGQSNDSWLHTSSGGAGNGTVNYSADDNPGSGYRTGTIAIGEQTFTVHQVGALSVPPVAVCQNVVAVADATCHATVPASAVDNGSFDNDGTIVSRVLSPPGPYPKGVTDVTLTVTDNDGAPDSCGATITVEDHTPPVITCSGNITTNVPSGTTNAVVTFSPPVASDNCGAASANCGPPPGTTFPIGTTPVTCIAIDPSGNSNTCGFTVTVRELPPEPHDLAVIRIQVIKNVNLKAAGPVLTKRVVVQIQNLSAHNETINDLATLANLVSMTLSNLHASCTPPAADLIMGPPNGVPKTLKPKGKLNVFFTVMFSPDGCVPDPDKSTKKSPGHEDFSYTATVNHAALNGNPDTVPSNDTCPRPPNPAIGDPGCGNKNPDHAPGANVTTDVFVK